MKNYTFGWVLRDRGYVEIPEEQYTDRQRDMKKYIEVLSEAVRKAKCGWDSVKYKLMKINDYAEPYMVLYVDDSDARWIPIDGNSKGCCLEVLGKNIW